MLIDLDPRAAATRWFNVQPTAEGLHGGAILADAGPECWVEELAVPLGWFKELRVVPLARSLSNREADNSDHLEVRLRVALEGLNADLKVSPEEEALLLRAALAQGVTIPRLLVESALTADRSETATERKQLAAEIFKAIRLLAAVSNNVNKIAGTPTHPGRSPPKHRPRSRQCAAWPCASRMPSKGSRSNDSQRDAETEPPA
ncbi:ParA family protein [Arthrobacter halodurans]